MKDFMFLVRGHCEPAPGEEHKSMEKFVAWMQDMTAKGRYVGGQPLNASTGRMVLRSGEVLTDGPFMASKEIIGGYVIVKADNLEDAVATAKTCPILQDGDLEVRELKEMN